MYNITEDGRWVSAEVQRIGEIIKDYDESLELAWVPPEARELNEEFPYAVMGRDNQGRPYVVMRIRESEMDHRVLERLWSQDNGKGDVLSAIDAKNAALHAIELKKQMDAIEEQRELAAWMIKAPVGAMHNGVRLT